MTSNRDDELGTPYGSLKFLRAEREKMLDELERRADNETVLANKARKLRAENERLRDGLRKMLWVTSNQDHGGPLQNMATRMGRIEWYDHLSEARAKAERALNPEPAGSAGDG